MAKGYTRQGILVVLVACCAACAQFPVTREESGALSDDASPPAVMSVAKHNPNFFEPPLVRPSETQAGDFNSQIALLAEQLEQNLDKKLSGSTYIVTSFANLDKMNETSAFGRLVAENLMHELQVRNWRLFDVRLTKEVIVNDNGEFSLSRDLKKIRESYKVSGILVGTYSVNRSSIILNARVINLDTGLVASAGQINIPMNAFSDNLLYASDKTTMKIVGEFHAR